jgi:MFS family permease
MAVGLGLQAIALGWMAAVATPDLPFSHLVLPFVIAGMGMGLFFAPVANVVLSAVRPEEEGQASGANNALREMGGVFGVAVLAAIFAHGGSYPAPPDFSGQPFVDGMVTAVWIGAAVVAVGAVMAAFVPRVRREAGPAVDATPAFAGMGSCVPTSIEHVTAAEGGVVPATEV